MDRKTHWIFDNFHSDAHLMRQKIDYHFTESIGNKLPFDERAIWNYWFIPGLYTYLRALPQKIYPDLHGGFMNSLKDFAAKEYGLSLYHNPYLSMYVNGCGQNIHNDAENGRVAYVFSLTKWQERHFTGGETRIYKIGGKLYENSFAAKFGHGFYDFVEPLFNRLTVFDDRLPHAVEPVQGSMNPQDARFAIHGHMEDPKNVPFIEGGLVGFDLSDQYEQLKQPVSKIFKSHSCHGFITLEVLLNQSGIAAKTNIKHMQLMHMSDDSYNFSPCLDNALDAISGFVWPMAATPSKLVFAISSGPLREMR